MIKKMWVQIKVNNPMCLLGMKDYCPFEVLLPKVLNEIFCNLLFIIFTIAPIYHMFCVNHLKNKYNFFKMHKFC